MMPQPPNKDIVPQELTGLTCEIAPLDFKVVFDIIYDPGPWKELEDALNEAIKDMYNID